MPYDYAIELEEELEAETKFSIEEGGVAPTYSLSGDSLLLAAGAVFVLEEPKLKLALLERYYNNLSAGHFG
ncbi:hypothetical protein B0A50_02115 [Salinomyces thailandicus]|uniref:Uncharacterized protein n=1 Tax=Salinomyces thailandicus TaxID=706561 RepID=A0A4U0U9K9_9PEZI|nr:hypothetical protein B0A50_02115 [Salinomyces thailandica]